MELASILFSFTRHCSRLLFALSITLRLSDLASHFKASDQLGVASRAAARFHQRDTMIFVRLRKIGPFFFYLCPVRPLRLHALLKCSLCVPRSRQWYYILGRGRAAQLLDAQGRNFLSTTPGARGLGW